MDKSAECFELLKIAKTKKGVSDKRRYLSAIITSLVQDITENGLDGSSFYKECVKQQSEIPCDSYWILAGVSEAILNDNARGIVILPDECFNVLFENKSYPAVQNNTVPYMPRGLKRFSEFQKFQRNIAIKAKSMPQRQYTGSLSGNSNQQSQGQAILQKASANAFDILQQARQEAAQIIASAKEEAENARKSFKYEMYQPQAGAKASEDIEDIKSIAEEHVKWEAAISNDIFNIRQAIQTGLEAAITNLSAIQISMDIKRMKELVMSIRELDSFSARLMAMTVSEQSIMNIGGNVKTIRTRLMRSLAKMGIEEFIPVVGSDFNPEEHEDADSENYGYKYRIKKVLYSGYRYGNNVLAKAYVETQG